MSGTIRFDDDHIVKFRLDAENKHLSLDVTVGDLNRVLDVDLTEEPK